MPRLDSILAGGLPGEPGRLAALDRAIRAPLPLSTGVGVLAADAEAPTALVAALLAGVLAARRPHRVLAVGAQAVERGIGWQVGLSAGAASSQADIAARAVATNSTEATAGLARSTGGAWALELGERPSAWWEAVAPISRFFDFVVTDWGAPDELDDSRAASAIMLVVTGAQFDAQQAGVDLVARLSDPGTAVLLAVADTGTGTRALREVAKVTGACWLPADRRLRSARPAPTDSLRYATSRSVLELAAAVVDAAVARNLAGVDR